MFLILATPHLNKYNNELKLFKLGFSQFYYIIEVSANKYIFHIIFIETLNIKFNSFYSITMYLQTLYLSKYPTPKRHRHHHYDNNHYKWNTFYRDKINSHGTVLYYFTDANQRGKRDNWHPPDVSSWRRRQSSWWQHLSINFTLLIKVQFFYNLYNI